MHEQGGKGNIPKSNWCGKSKPILCKMYKFLFVYPLRHMGKEADNMIKTILRNAKRLPGFEKGESRQWKSRSPIVSTNNDDLYEPSVKSGSGGNYTIFGD